MYSSFFANRRGLWAVSPISGLWQIEIVLPFVILRLRLDEDE